MSHRLDLAEAEVEEDRLLHPLVHAPVAVARLGDPDRACIEQRDRLLDGLGVELTDSHISSIRSASSIVRFCQSTLPRISTARSHSSCVGTRAKRT